MQLSNSLIPKSSASSGYLLRQYGGAAAAYSLQRLDTSSENVVRVRESVGDTEADFTAEEVSGGALREFALQNDADIIRFANQATAADKRMYFDGGSVSVSDSVVSSLYVKGTFVLQANDRSLITKGTSRSSYVEHDWDLFQNGSNLVFRGITPSSLILFQIQTSLPAMNDPVEVIGSWDGVDAKIFIDGVEKVSAAVSGTLANRYPVNIGGSGAYGLRGLCYDVTVNSSVYNGYGNTDADWTDQVGSNDGTVFGSPALFSGQGFDAFVTTWYDQSGSLGQPLSRFANRATAADQRMQFDGVDDYVEVSGMGTANDYFGACTISASVVVLDDSANQIVWTLGSAAYRLQIFSGVWWLNGASTGLSITNQNEPQTIAVDYDSSGAATELRVNGVTGWTGTKGANTNGQTWFRIGQTTSLPFKGLIYDFSLSGSAVKNFSFNGYGNTDADWTDQVGSNDGTVNGSPSLYEGRNATQAIAANQPQIVADGVVVTDANGNASINGDGSDDYLQNVAAAWDSVSGDASILLVADGSTDVDAAAYAIGSGAGNEVEYLYGWASTAGNYSARSETTSYRLNSRATSGTLLHSHYVSTAAYIDGVVQDTTSAATAGVTADRMSIFSRTNGALPVATKISELIIYPTDQSANRTAIESNIANRYGITLA